MLFLHGLGHFHPDTVLTNAFLENLDIGVEASWIIERVGIEQRRTVLPLDYIRQTRNRDPREAAECSAYSNRDTAVKAAKQALDRAGLRASEIGMVIAGGCSPQSTVPAEACHVAAALDIHAPAFDLNAGCATFAAQIYFLMQWEAAALPEFVLLVNPENNTRVVDYADKRSAVLWGDGTSAAIVSKRVRAKQTISSARYETDPRGAGLVAVPTGGHFRQNGQAVQHFAIRKTSELFHAGRSEGAGENGDTYFVGHQANLRMLESACRRAGVEPRHHLSSVQLFGNCGAAGAPSVISQHWDRLVGGCRVLLAVVGAGLAWGSVEIEFGGRSNAVSKT